MSKYPQIATTPETNCDMLKEHKHLCDCGYCWKHSNGLQQEANYGYVSHDEYVKEHTCPQCGKDCRKKYWNDEERSILDFLSELLGALPEYPETL